MSFGSVQTLCAHLHLLVASVWSGVSEHFWSAVCVLFLHISHFPSPTLPKNTQRQQRHATHTALAELAFPIAEEATRLFNATLNSVRGACERGGARSNQVFERRWSWFCIRAVMERPCCATKLHGDRRRPPTRAAQRHKWPDDSLRRLEERGARAPALPCHRFRRDRCTTRCL